MVNLKKLELTEAIRARLAIVRRAEECMNGDGRLQPYSLVERLKFELAEEVIAEVARQEMVRAARVADIDRQLERRPAVVVEVTLRPKRKREA